MPTYDLFSKRQKRLKGKVPDVFTYESIPQNLRVQIVHIISDSIGVRKDFQEDKAGQAYDFIFNTLCREYGRFNLTESLYNESHAQQIFNFFLQTKITDEVLDVVELSFQYINNTIKEYFNQYIYFTHVKIKPDDAVAELNERFKENSIGYSFESNQLIRIDSTFIHTEITKPTIALLRNAKLKGANEEYLKAHEHYKHGRNGECLMECLKAFESTMKVICKEKRWSFDQTDTAKKLIQICFQYGLIPTFTQNQFTSLQNLLESGIPTIRNKLGGHGQGQLPQVVSNEITRYGLNLTGANIIFLIEQSGLK